VTKPAPHDDDPPRLQQSVDDFERLLVRSARLDESELAARDDWRRTIAGQAQEALARRRKTSRSLIVLAAALAVAATAVVGLMRHKATKTTERVAAESMTSPPRSAPLPAPAASVMALEPCPGVVAGGGSLPMIDDFEDRNARLLVQDGRSGVWLSSGDPQSKQTPRAGTNAFPVAIPHGRQRSRFGLRFFGGQLRAGAGLDGRFSDAKCYDASRYEGIELWAKGPGRIHVMVSMLDVIERKYGGLCDQGCYDPHRVPLDLSASWQRFRIPWSDLHQVGYGKPLAFDPQRLASVQLFVDAADSPFDVWFDDVAFIAPTQPPSGLGRP
jgi:hypothetical protein